ncbi:MAG: hypothetical protein JWO05_89 [Gemmatimonadetes bacterium]|nr:hypothetical protein [Gemmatimonadota bacterium]
MLPLLARPAQLRGALIATLAAGALVAGCKDSRSKNADSDLSRDMALAGQVQAQPTFQDTALGAAPTRSPQPPVVAASPAPQRGGGRVVTSTVRRPAPVPVPQPTRVAEAPAAAPAPAPARGQIGAGSGISMTSNSKVCTSALVGDKLTATVMQDVTGSNGARIPAGSRVVLEVAAVSSGDNPQLSLRVKSVIIGDMTFPVTGQVATDAGLERTQVAKAGNSDTKKVIGGAIAGAVLGQIFGKSTKSTVIGAAAGAAAGTAAAKMSTKYESCLAEGAQLRVNIADAIVM